jgi:hypothetical protein
MLNINLLPPAYKKEIADSKDNKSKAKILFYLVVFLIVLAILSFFKITTLKEKTDEVSLLIKSTKAEIEINEPIEKEFKSLNLRIAQLKKIIGSQFFPSKLYYEIGKNKPAGVAIKDINIENDPKKEQTITGESISLDLIAEFKENLENSDLVNSAKIKYLVLTDKKIYAFEIKLALEKGALK